MLNLSKQLLRNYPKKHSVRYAGYGNPGGIPGCNLPFSVDNPYKFTVYFTLFGVLGFGAPWLIVMHQMLRPYDY